MIEKKEALKKGVKIIDTKEPHNALLENLKTNFPQTIKDGRADLKTIAMLLGLSEANMQGYELTFTGKGLANALYSTPTQKCLKVEEHFSPAVSAEKDEASAAATPQNFIIRGDNLDALKILKAAYTEKIKMIYIDPPYNTEGEGFIYPDNFRKDYKAILQEVGLLEIDEEGNELESETLQFFKNIQSTRTHSGWLAFMLPRIKLARDLLREDGVIFISIDDNEQANLKILCDEIFGEENFVRNIVWNSVSSVLKQSKHIRKEHEYILVYAKDKDNLLFSKLENTMKFENPDNDPKGEWFSSNAASANQYKDNNKFAIQLPNGDECIRNWKFSYDEFINGEVNLYFKGGNVPRLKIYKKDYNALSKVQSSILSGFGSLTSAKDEIKLLLGSDKELFDTPKPTILIKHLLKIATVSTQISRGGESTTANIENSEGDLVLDFFAGSGTTAQAVMELNQEDGGGRKFILVQLDEPILETKSKAAYDFCKNTLKSKAPVISDITIERVRRAAAKIFKDSPENAPIFSVLSLDDKPELITKKGALELVYNTLSPYDKALNLALESGKMLHQPLKAIFKDKLYQCEDSLYLIALDKEVLEFLRTTQNEYIFIDGFENISLEDFLNLDVSFSERLRVVY